MPCPGLKSCHVSRLGNATYTRSDAKSPHSSDTGCRRAGRCWVANGNTIRHTSPYTGVWYATLGHKNTERKSTFDQSELRSEIPLNQGGKSTAHECQPVCVAGLAERGGARYSGGNTNRCFPRGI